MLSNTAVKASNLGKSYLIYKSPQDRLKQMILRRRKYYQEYWAIQNISLDIKKNETVGIIGRNGSGKSTLLQIIAGTLKSNSGTLEVHGRVAPLLELGAGFNPEFSGRENLRLSATILGLSAQQIEQREPLILDFAGIGDFIDQPVKTYSSGMYARLAFAVAAHVDADILIVDEILSVGDAAFTQKCMRFIRNFKKNGTLLFVSHDTAVVNALCDRAIWIHNGQVQLEGSAKDVSLAYQSSLYGDTEDGTFSINGRRREAPKTHIEADVRHNIIRDSDKRNVLKVFDFNPEAPSFGLGDAKITDVTFLDKSDTELRVVEGGEEITLGITCEAKNTLKQPIIGFLVKDKLGQNLFGDNTYLTFAENLQVIEAGTAFEARFTFRLPYLPSGEYAVAVALASGTQEEHVQHHWIDEALVFRSESSYANYGRTGLVGIPMRDITIEALDR